jgi:hypothetical protein
MNDYFFFTSFNDNLGFISFLFFRKTNEMGDRDSVQKSFSIRFTVTLIAGIIIWIYKIIKT